MQMYLFGAAALVGGAVSLTYDLLGLFRLLLPVPGWLYALQNMAFWLMEALMIYRFLFRYDDGAIRSYTILGMILGMALYLWCSKPVKTFFGRHFHKRKRKKRKVPHKNVENNDEKE